MDIKTQLKITPGQSFPLGVCRKGHGINFAIFSQHATTASLCLFTPGAKQPFAEIALDAKVHQTGWIWHIHVAGAPEHLEYGWKIDGPKDKPGYLFNPDVIISDPYARALSTSYEWDNCPLRQQEKFQPRGRAVLEHPFDWQGDHPPNIPPEQLILYEMHVRAYTQSPSGRVYHPGTYLGLVDKIPHLKTLGVNAVELLPIFEFNECEYDKTNLKTGKRLLNVWGYSTINFFAPMQRYSYSSEWNAAITEFKTLVRELHKNGIEVILDVVYNHTAEGDTNGPLYSFRGIDNTVYYMVNQKGHYLDFTGTGNTFNCNHPVVTRLILDSLRYWATEMHVDGFRFDLASALTRDEDGTPLAVPPVIQAITYDPVLAHVKLIAEAWDAGGLYQVGNFPGEGRWAEWNGKFRDVVRKFIKGTDGLAGEFARALAGSDDLYGKDRAPYHSINFITAHDGFSLRDLVTYQEKHNETNAEENRDGMNNNDSWNCGHEGPTHNWKILTLRERQMRNFHTVLLLSIGVPMLLMGDEYGHTRNGNNNAWCQDNDLNWFLWDELEKNREFFRFYQQLIAFRKNHPILQREEFLTSEDIDWHGLEPMKANWGAESRFVACTIKDHVKNEHLYIAFNASFSQAHIKLPDPPHYKKWYRIIDTSLPPPQDFIAMPKGHPSLKSTYNMVDYSAFVAKAL